MLWRGLKFLYSITPVVWSLIKDLSLEDLSWKEIRTNFLFGEAHAFEQAGLFSRSIRIYEEILKRDSNSIPVLLGLGGLYYRMGRFEKAIRYYEKVIRINSKHYQSHYWLAMCFWKLERYYAAINTLDEVVEFLPTYKDALNLMGECYERIGEGAMAEHYYLKAISADPDGIIIHGGVLDEGAGEKVEAERTKH